MKIIALIILITVMGCTGSNSGSSCNYQFVCRDFDGYSNCRRVCI